MRACLRLFRQVLGVTCFSVDPYQIGLENDEALDSGAFWFYRKLGFRPLDADVAQLVRREEQKMLRKPGLPQLSTDIGKAGPFVYPVRIFRLRSRRLGSLPRTQPGPGDRARRYATQRARG